MNTIPELAFVILAVTAFLIVRLMMAVRTRGVVAIALSSLAGTGASIGATLLAMQVLTSA